MSRYAVCAPMGVSFIIQSVAPTATQDNTKQLHLQWKTLSTQAVKPRDSTCFIPPPPPLPSSSLAIQDNHATVKDAEESWHLLSLWHSDLRSSLFIQLHRHQSSCTLLCDGAVYTLPKEVGTPEQERQKKRREVQGRREERRQKDRRERGVREERRGKGEREER